MASSKKIKHAKIRRGKPIVWQCLSCKGQPLLPSCCKKMSCFTPLFIHAVEKHDLAPVTPQRIRLRKVWLVHYPRQRRLQQTEEIMLGDICVHRTAHFTYGSQNRPLQDIINDYSKLISHHNQHAENKG